MAELSPDKAGYTVSIRAEKCVARLTGVTSKAMQVEVNWQAEPTSWAPLL